jgi:chemotaxis protein methyltransferase CheR
MRRNCEGPDVTSTPDIELRLLLEAIFAQFQYDFRHYAPGPLKRRLGQAMPVFGVRTLSGLQERVLHEPATFSRLLAYLTVPVSEMFRDARYFRALREKVVPALRARDSVKVWVAGCSSGEEVYSLAILFREEELSGKVSIYATDISSAALITARKGIYAQERIAGFSRAYLAAGGRASLSDYYTLGYGSAIFDKSLRQSVVFSDHSLASDGVFAEVQLVSCRNVLIYFDRPLQDRAIGLFHASLSPRGFLGLGAKETLRFTAHEASFGEFVREQRIYQKRSSELEGAS